MEREISYIELPDRGGYDIVEVVTEGEDRTMMLICHKRHILEVDGFMDGIDWAYARQKHVQLRILASVVPEEER